MERMNFVLNLSLKEMALRRVAVDLWTTTDILSSIQELDFLYCYSTARNLLALLQYGRETLEVAILRDEEKQQSANIKVIDKVSKLILPESLKEEIMCIIRPIGSEIIKWKIFHEAILYQSLKYVDIYILKQILWTCTGSVNYIKTAEELIRLRAFDVVRLYKLACLFCLVDTIHVLWDELPNDYKEKLNVRIDYANSDEMMMLGLENYWAHVLREKQSKIHCPSVIPSLDVMLEYSAHRLYKEATIYFFERLPKRKRDALLMETACTVIESYEYILISNDRLCATLCYLLTQMNLAQKAEILKLRPTKFIRSFLTWPMQIFFLDIADLTWTVLPEIDYIKLLQLLSTNIVVSGNHFPNLFQEFFVCSPHSFKKCFVHEECQRPFLLNNFFHREDAETIKTIFRNIDNEDKMKLVFSDAFICVLDFYMKREKWTIIELCFHEFALSREDKDRFKNKFLEIVIEIYRDKPCETASRQLHWNRFFDFLDETFISALYKRSSEEGEQNKTKRDEGCSTKRMKK